MLDRQRATALYFIDKLALRAGGEKDTDEEADTVGCCNLRVEHVKCLPDLKIEFDFLGKDSIQYLNTVEVSPQVSKQRGTPRGVCVCVCVVCVWCGVCVWCVCVCVCVCVWRRGGGYACACEVSKWVCFWQTTLALRCAHCYSVTPTPTHHPQVYKNVQIFQRAKEPGDDLFDRLTVPMLNKYLQRCAPPTTTTTTTISLSSSSSLQLYLCVWCKFWWQLCCRLLHDACCLIY
jgi:hypothetical protein